jgi:acyl-CoA synthetase (AMP-forming)/AMP-acid ligase II
VRIVWQPAAAAMEPLAANVHGDLAALVYTSGSTGEPKGVMLTHDNLTAAAASIATYLENTGEDVILTVLPLHLPTGSPRSSPHVTLARPLVIERSFTYPAAVLDLMERERWTGFAMVPTIATLLMQHLKSRTLPQSFAT